MSHGLSRAASVVSGPRIMRINQFAKYIPKVDYLLNPPQFSNVPRRSGAAIAILVTYYFLLLPVLVSYARLIYTIITNPGYVPRGEQWELLEPQQKRHRHGRQHSRKHVEEKQRVSATWPGREYSPRNSDQ